MPNLGVIGRKINAREVDPNPHILFTSVLENKPNAEHALRMMKALAAQVRPLMQRNGIKVNSFEEYPFNKVFAGRNWNAGEVVEIVLRRPDNSFLPMIYLERTMTHELAHCHQMNHGPAFQKFWSDLQGEVHVLQRDGYFGDGFYSEGRRLGDSRPISSAERANGEVPELLCGGANNRSAPSRSARGYGRGNKRRRGQGLVNGVASTSSGAQTAKKRKTSRPNASSFVDKEGGNRLDGINVAELPDIKTIKANINAAAKSLQMVDGGSLAAAKRAVLADLDPKQRELLDGTSTGKRARTKSAAEMRAEAAERRIKAMIQPQSSKATKEEQSDSEDAYHTVGDELDYDDQDEGEDADFGPNAVKKMFGKMDAAERDAMTGGVSDDELKVEGDDMGPCGSAAPSSPRPETLPVIDDHKNKIPKTETIPPPDLSMPYTSGNSSAGSSSNNTRTFSAATLVKEETKRLRLRDPGHSLREPPKDIRYWRCTLCNRDSHQDYAHCPTDGCYGTNPSRKALGAPSPIVISDDDD